MAVSRSFKVLLAVALAATLGIKLFVAAGVENPQNPEIADALRPFFISQQFEVAGQTSFAGRSALIVQRGECLIYVIPVAQQGWHQATVAMAVHDSSLQLWFEFDGHITPREQPQLLPTAIYYLNKSLRYVGIDMPYPPVLGLVATKACDVERIDWSGMPNIPFKALTMRTE